jgi:hypothetical protein
VNLRTLSAVPRVFCLALVLALVAAGAASADRGDPKERYTPRDQARARSMLLRTADFNAAFVAHPSTSGNGDFYCSALDESDLTLTGKSQSPNFTAGTEYVTSTASVYATRSDSSASWRRGTSRAGEQCLRIGLRSQLQGTAVRLVSFRRMAFPARGTHSVAYRAVATVQGVRVYVDLVAMQVSRAQTGVVYVSALVPPPGDELRRLTGLVAARTERAMRA